MYCTTCAQFNPIGSVTCRTCGAPLRPIDRHDAHAATGHRRRRQVVAGLPMALLIALLILVGVQRVNERRAATASYAAAERALAAGDLIGAQARFAAAGGYRDAEARVDEVVTLLATYRNAYGDATVAFNSGQYDLAIATLLPVLVALPNDIDSLALIETARGERRRALEREAALAEEIGDWYHAERALAALVRDDPENAGYAQRLSDIRMNRAPFVYARNGTIYVGGAETYSDRAILTGYDAAWPVWSPDRARIAFVNSASSQRDLAGRLYVVDGDGSNPRLLASDVLAFSWPVWSPDGSKIAITSAAGFDMDTGNGHIGLLVIDVESGASRDVTGDRYDFAASPSWSPDGERLAFVERRVTSFSGGPRFENGDVWIVEVASGVAVNLTGDAILEERQVSWSPAGDRVSVITDPGDWNSERQAEIYLVHVETGETRLVPTGRQPTPPAWSPDGSRIAFVEGDNVIRVWSETASHWIPMSTGVDNYLSWSTDGMSLVAPGLTIGQPSYLVPLAAGAGPPVPFRMSFDYGNRDGGPPVWAPRTAEAIPPQAAGTALDPAT